MFFNRLVFISNIFFWYFFTIISALYTKKLLNKTNNPFLLTLVTFSYGFLFYFIIKLKSILKELKNLLVSKTYFFLALLNIGANFLTNISINETSVAFTYMIKASEPVFVLVLSYLVLGQKFSWRIVLTLIPICVGVSLTIVGEIRFSFYGFVSIFVANLSTASRNVFFKSSEGSNANDSNCNKHSSVLESYLKMCFSSFLLFLIIFLCHVLINPSTLNLFKLHEIDSILFNLFVSSFSNFLYNLFSFKVLSNITPISHSVLNIMKRVLTVMSSFIYFSNQISQIQVYGMLFSDFGVFLYSYFKLRDQKRTRVVSKTILYSLEKLIGFLVFIAILGSLFCHSNYQESSLVLSPAMRGKCIAKIKEQIKNQFAELITLDQSHVHLLDVPLHDNYGDTLIWYSKISRIC